MFTLRGDLDLFTAPARSRSACTPGNPSLGDRSHCYRGECLLGLVTSCPGEEQFNLERPKRTGFKFLRDFKQDSDKFQTEIFRQDLNKIQARLRPYSNKINHRSVIVSDNDQKLALKLASLEGLRRES